MKILVIRFSSIGDIILTTPVLRCLKQQLPDCEIHFATKSQFRELVLHNAHLSKVHVLASSLGALARELRKENFDVIVDLHNSLRSRLLRLRLRSRSYVVRKLNRSKRKMVRTKKVNGHLRHFSERCLDAVAPLGIKNDHLGLEYFIPNDANVDMASFPPSHQAGYVACGIGARHFTKRLPPEKLVSVCNKIKQPIMLLGDQNDFEIAEQVVKEVGERVINTCGKFSINQTASLIQQSKVVVSHDSAVMHIAAALKKPVVSIWGNTVPEFGMYPYFGQEGIVPPLGEIVQVSGLSCRPCSKLGYKKCPQGHFACMKGISEIAVASAVSRFWNVASL